MAGMMPAVKTQHRPMETDSMPARPVTAHEREEIRAGIERGETDQEIADRIGRHRTTVNVEINRNGARKGYSATRADGRAVLERKRPKTAKLAADPQLAAHVTARLVGKDSPMTIARELASGVHGLRAALSHESIYQAIYAHGTRGLAKGLHEGLHRRRRCRKHRRPAGTEAPTKSPLGSFNPIGCRPEVASRRTEVGHFEGDLICGAMNRSAIATVFDRASRYLWLADFPEDHGAEAALGALVEILVGVTAEVGPTATARVGPTPKRWDCSHHHRSRRCIVQSLAKSSFLASVWLARTCSAKRCQAAARVMPSRSAIWAQEHPWLRASTTAGRSLLSASAMRLETRWISAAPLPGHSKGRRSWPSEATASASTALESPSVCGSM